MKASSIFYTLLINALCMVFFFSYLFVSEDEKQDLKDSIQEKDVEIKILKDSNLVQKDNVQVIIDTVFLPDTQNYNYGSIMDSIRYVIEGLDNKINNLTNDLETQKIAYNKLRIDNINKRKALNKKIRTQKKKLATCKDEKEELQKLLDECKKKKEDKLKAPF